MSKKTLIFLCLLALLTAACNSTPPANSNRHSTSSAETKIDHQRVKLQAQELVDAMMKGNFERASDLTHPKLVELMGGREKYIATLKEFRAEVESNQSELPSLDVGDPREVVEINRQHYAIIPTTLRIKVPEGTLVGDGFMIGTSADGGQNWTFVDSGGRSINKDQLRMFFGPAADQLKIPEVKEPVLQK
jgi:hypothetical protein